MSHHHHHGHHSGRHGKSAHEEHHAHAGGRIRRGRTYRQTFRQEMEELIVFFLFAAGGFGFCYAGTELVLHALWPPDQQNVPALVQPTPTAQAEIARGATHS